MILGIDEYPKIQTVCKECKKTFTETYIAWLGHKERCDDCCKKHCYYNLNTIPLTHETINL